MTTDGLIHVSTPLMGVVMMPLVGMATISYSMGLGLEQAVLIGIVRTGAQLTLSGWILQPIFHFGVEQWPLVLCYTLFMTVLAAWETGRRCKYYFEHMFLWILVAFCVNILWVSLFSFGLILHLDPLWNPYYVIPICGMLLGNCVNGVALTLDRILIALKEQSAEIELLLSFGATCSEASAHLVRDAIRVGAMPMVNGMSVIGLVSIPGMMTGQILGGSPVVEAARYQILITYLICQCTFATILTVIYIAQKVACDSQQQRLQTDRLQIRSKEDKERLPLRKIARMIRFLFHVCCATGATDSADITAIEKHLINAEEGTKSSNSQYGSSHGEHSTITFVEVRPGNCNKTIRPPVLQVRRVSRTVSSGHGQADHTLFRNISLDVSSGSIVVCSGPSGVGKSQLLRLIAGLSPMDAEKNKPASDILLHSKSRREFANPANWRQQVRYVSQYKIDIAGTPRQFIERVVSFRSWRPQGFAGSCETRCAPPPPPLADMIGDTKQLVSEWGLNPHPCLDEEWRHLSGGEAQRIYLAIALASKPALLLMDESTSSLDTKSKQQVEQSILKAAALGLCVLWISHDDVQIKRIQAGEQLFPQTPMRFPTVWDEQTMA